MDNTTLAAKRIRITNMLDADVSIIYPELRINRNLNGLNASITLPGDQVKELLEASVGFKYMVEQGIVSIDKAEDREILELEEDGIKVPKIFTKDTMIKLLKGVPFSEFSKEVQSMTKEQQKNLADMAIELQILDLEKTELLTKLTEKQILKAIMLNREVAAAEAKAAASK